MYFFRLVRKLIFRSNLLVVIGVAASATAGAQTPAWVQLSAPGTNAHVYKMRTDATGNLYVIGHFSGTLALNPDTLSTLGGNNYDIFIGKFSPDGNCLWARQAGNNRKDFGVDLVIAPSGRVFFSGLSFPAGTFGPHTVPGTNQAHSTPVVGEISPAGDFVWVQAAQVPNGMTFNNYDNYAESIALDASENVYITGHTTDSLTFTSLAPVRGGFYAKFTTTGTPVWVRQSVPGSWYMRLVSKVQVSPNGNIIVLGKTETSYNPLRMQSRLVCLDPQGNLLWMHTLGDASNDVQAWDLLQYANGDLVVTGSVKGSVSVGAATVTSPSARFAGFLAKFTSTGSLVWLKPSNSGTGNSYPIHLGATATGGLLLTGSFTGPAQFGATSLTSAGLTDAFFSAYDTDGNALHAMRLGGPDDDHADGFLPAPNGDFFFGAFYGATATFGSQAFPANGPEGSMVFGRTGFITAAPESVAGNTGRLLAFPNPAGTNLTIRLPGFTGPAIVRLVNVLGKTVREQTTAAFQTEISLTVENLPSGYYLLQLTNGKSTFSESVLISR